MERAPMKTLSIREPRSQDVQGWEDAQGGFPTAALTLVDAFPTANKIQAEAAAAPGFTVHCFN
jgi:hypothetical protein